MNQFVKGKYIPNHKLEVCPVCCINKKMSCYLGLFEHIWCVSSVPKQTRPSRQKIESNLNNTRFSESSKEILKRPNWIQLSRGSDENSTFSIKENSRDQIIDMARHYSTWHTVIKEHRTAITSTQDATYRVATYAWSYFFHATSNRHQIIDPIPAPHPLLFRWLICNGK